MKLSEELRELAFQTRIYDKDTAATYETIAEKVELLEVAADAGVEFCKRLDDAKKELEEVKRAYRALVDKTAADRMKRAYWAQD